MDKKTGAPPDDYAQDGQNWGFPTYNWEEMRKVCMLCYIVLYICIYIYTHMCMYMQDRCGLWHARLGAFTYMHTCIQTCIYIYRCIYIYICIYTYIYICMYVYMIPTYIHTSILFAQRIPRMCGLWHARLGACTYMHTCIHTCVYIYIYIYI
jgi:hypothetical protein